MIKEKDLPDFSFEKSYWEQGLTVAGIDEAGRGALAGPVVAAAVILNDNFNVEVNDSKKLTAKQRNNLFNEILEKSVQHSISFVDNNVIDEINILNATFKAMNEAAENFYTQPDILLIDGNRFKTNIYKFQTLIKGDSISKSIAAASILAKVARDRYMAEIANEIYPDYDFASHKGYGTKKHIERIKEYGPSELHRKTFLKNVLSNQLQLL